MNDFDRIATSINYLSCNYQQQPGIEDMAAVVGLSPSHFHRMFSSWAGVTPKAFLKALTYTHARQKLMQGASVLNAALETGLSGPGRLHDLTVSLEAVSPGELKNSGEGTLIKYGFSVSPFGTCLIAGNDRGICRLSFLEIKEKDDAVQALKKDWQNALIQENNGFADQWCRRIFRFDPIKPQQKPHIRLWVRGTGFQLLVWHALLRIPSGIWVGYQQLAASIGRPKASRAVGNAVGANPVAFLIPCHRVIRRNGELGGYRWGLERKRMMMAVESSRLEVAFRQ